MALGNGIASSVVHGADGGDGAMHCEGHMLEEGKVPYICPNHKKKKKNWQYYLTHTSLSILLLVVDEEQKVKNFLFIKEIKKKNYNHIIVIQSSDWFLG